MLLNPQALNPTPPFKKKKAGRIQSGQILNHKAMKSPSALSALYGRPIKDESCINHKFYTLLLRFEDIDVATSHHIYQGSARLNTCGIGRVPQTSNHVEKIWGPLCGPQPYQNLLDRKPSKTPKAKTEAHIGPLGFRV